MKLILKEFFRLKWKEFKILLLIIIITMVVMVLAVTIILLIFFLLDIGINFVISQFTLNEIWYSIVWCSIWIYAILCMMQESWNPFQFIKSNWQQAKKNVLKQEKLI